MYLDMSCLHTNNSLASQEDGIDDCRVGLGSTHEEGNIRIFHADGLANLLFGGFCIGVKSISGSLLVIGLA